MVVVTGGAGFIGSAFIAKLNEMGVTDIVVVDSADISDRIKNLATKQFADFIEKELFLRKLETNSIRHITSIVHLGAISSTTETNRALLEENNFRYTQRLAQWALRHNARFIYASSAATYGNGENGFSDEPDDLIYSLTPLNAYGLSKQMFDRWALENSLFGKIVGIKFFNVFGPNEYHKGEMRSLVCKAYYQIQEYGFISLFRSYKPEYNDGEQLRDFIYVKDCTEVLWWFMKNPAVHGMFNLGTGRARSWNDLARAIFSALGRKPIIQYIDMPETIKHAYQYRTEATMAKLRRAGYQREFFSLEDAVKEYVLNYLHPELRYL